VYVVDADRTSTSRGLVQKLVGSGRFSVGGSSASPARADDALLGGDADLILHVPEGFERRLVRSGGAPVQLVLDAEDGVIAGVTRSYVTSILADYAVELTPRLRAAAPVAVMAPPPASAPRIEVRARAWYNPDLDYDDYM